MHTTVTTLGAHIGNGGKSDENQHSLPDVCVDHKMNLIVISKQLDVYSRMMDCILPNTEVFSYDEAWTDEIFTHNLKEFLDKFADHTLYNAGWIFHGNSKTAFTLGSDKSILLDGDNLVDGDVLSTSWRHICTYLSMIEKKMRYRRFDLIACCLTLNPMFQEVKSYIEKQTKLNLASSDDSTGNAVSDNWILESHGIDLIGMYFKSDTNEILGNIKVSLKELMKYSTSIDTSLMAAMGANWSTLLYNGEVAVNPKFTTLLVNCDPVKGYFIPNPISYTGDVLFHTGAYFSRSQLFSANNVITYVSPDNYTRTMQLTFTGILSFTIDRNVSLVERVTTFTRETGYSYPDPSLYTLGSTEIRMPAGNSVLMFGTITKNTNSDIYRRVGETYAVVPPDIAKFGQINNFIPELIGKTIYGLRVVVPGMYDFDIGNLNYIVTAY